MPASVVRFVQWSYYIHFSKKLLNHLPARRQSQRLRLFARDPHGVMNRCGEVGGCRWPVVRMFAARVAAADDAAAMHAAAGQYVL